MATNTNTIPSTVKNAISGSVSVMLASLAIPQDRVAAALRALFHELDGTGGVYTLTNSEPLDRSVKREAAADILGVTKSTISKMVGRGTLRAVYGGKDGKRLTGISEASIRAFMEQGKAVA